MRYRAYMNLRRVPNSAREVLIAPGKRPRAGSAEALNSDLDRAIDDFDGATRNADRLLRISSLRRIDDLCRKILAQRPANSEAWALLADAELKKGGSIDQALRFYELSHLTSGGVPHTRDPSAPSRFPSGSGARPISP